MNKPKLNQIRKILEKWFKTKKSDELTNLIIEKNLSTSVLIPKEDYKAYSFYTNTMAIIPKNKAFEKFIKNNFEEEGKSLKLDYTPKNFQEIRGLYFIELIREIIKLIKRYERVIIKIGVNYPLWAEVTDFIIVLAPIEEGQELK